ncbi:DUF192 domain-containing protein [Derxia gummosa]|uniref:DUF192 domain-containing protein n=1 Tax=Derxia gummosa DSM 723 TaxID=1121388 RepID=A0A8B6XCV8_9BURK|nr:DUF192 domain-containing protein [Derxia gummosa]
MQKQSSARTARFARRVMGAVALAWSVGVSAQQAMPVTELSSGIHLIRAEVAATPADRQRGLMFREAMGPGAGMLFVFDAPSQQCMWMRNTLIPLAVAFIDDDGRIVNVEEMAPQTDATHCSAQPVRYALEMNAGWFTKRGIRPGAVIDGIARKR